MENEIIHHVTFLRKHAFRLTEDHDSADDLVQQTVLRAIEKKHLFKKDTNLKVWLYVILLNCFRNNYKKSKYRKCVSIDETWDKTSFKDGNYVYPNQICSIQLREINERLSKMSNERQNIFCLYFMDGLKYEEIAGIVNIPVGTVKSKIARIRQELREKTG